MPGPFDMQQQFPIAAVIDAIQKKAVYQNQMQRQQTQDLLTGIQGAGEGLDSYVQTRRNLANAMAAGAKNIEDLPNVQAQKLGSLYNFPSSSVQGLTPDQVEKAGSVRSHQIDLTSLLSGLNGGGGSGAIGATASTPSMPGASNASLLPAAQAPAPGAPPVSSGTVNGMPPASPLMLTSSYPKAGAPVAQPPPQQNGNAPVAPDQPHAFVNPSALRIGLALKKATMPQQVMSQSDALAQGQVAPGTRILQNPGTQDLKTEKYQSALEQQAINGLRSLRGDPALSRIETQRDAAIQATNRLQQVEMSGKGLNPIDYVDTLGQIYKARTGAAPTDTVLQDARQQTVAGNFGKVYTFFTGQQAPATTKAITSSLKDMAIHMGLQADELHDGYMQTHGAGAFPSDLDPSRAARLAKLSRGKSFVDATGVKPEDYDIHLQGIKWAQEHPNDPRSGPILQKALAAKNSGGNIGL